MPHAILVNGQQITGLDPSRPEDRIAGGWLQVTPEQYAAAQSMARPQWDGTQVVEGPEPPPVDPLAVRAAALLAEEGSNLGEDVARFVAQVQALAAAGVTLPEPLTFRELMTAIESKWPADPGQAAAAGLRLRTAWDDVVYHAGTLREADELFPYLMQCVVSR